MNNTISELIGPGNPYSHECYIVGDMNIDYLQPANADTKKLKEIEFKYNLRQLISSPTRYAQNSKSIIDPIFTTLSPDLIISSGVEKAIIISDHLPVYIIKKKAREHHPKRKIQVRKKSIYNPDYFKNLLLSDPGWQNFWCIHATINELWGQFVDIITRCLNVLCPQKWITVREDQPDWFDGELRAAIDKKVKSFKRARITKLDTDWQLYTGMKNTIRLLIIKKKCDYISTKIQENRNAPKKF